MFTNVGLVLNICLYVYTCMYVCNAPCRWCNVWKLCKTTSCKVPLIDNHVEFYKDGKWLTFCASWQDQQCSSFVPYIRYHGSPVATTRLFRGLHINISSEYLQRICISLNAICQMQSPLSHSTVDKWYRNTKGLGVILSMSSLLID